MTLRPLTARRLVASLRRAGALGCLCAMAVLATGCSAARVGIGPNANPCYRAVAAAADALHHKGHLSGVEPTDTASLLRALRGLRGHVPVPRALTGRREGVCVVSYTGQFLPGSVRAPWLLLRAPADLAAVVVRTRDARPLATILTSRSAARRARIAVLNP
ncbi:MAG: hypothetical protein M0004_08665 [Actinomycetota bacterium]|nr:hypothetical protein [Actinomycetota bacterium]